MADKVGMSRGGGLLNEEELQPMFIADLRTLKGILEKNHLYRVGQKDKCAASWLEIAANGCENFRAANDDKLCSIFGMRIKEIRDRDEVLGKDVQF